MGILGITNRTENWKTARSFAPFFTDECARIRLVNRLLEPLGEAHEVQEGTAKIELFWKGVRDYLKRENLKSKEGAEALRQSYLKEFCNLRETIEDFNRSYEHNKEVSTFNDLEDRNYDASMLYKTRISDKLTDNLRNTEIDVVLETQNYLFIGEAKQESPLDAKSQYILVHQLIREYVTAKILVDITRCDKQVVPFVVGDSKNLGSLRNTAQVKFMVHQCWLTEENILSWDCIEGIAKSEATNC